MCACGADRRAGWQQCCDSMEIKKLFLCKCVLGNRLILEHRVGADEDSVKRDFQRDMVEKERWIGRINVKEVSVKGYNILIK